MAKVAVAPKRVVEDDEDDFRQRAVINRKEKKESGIFKMPEGETIFRILKTPRDKERNSPSVWMEYYVHRNVGPKKLGPLRCGLNVADDSGSCWLCSMVEKLRENGKGLAATEIEKKTAYAIQIAVWDENLQDLRGPLLWLTSSGKTAKSLSYKFQTIIGAPAAKGYVDHEDGYNFSIERSGTGLNDTVYGAPERAEERTAVPKGIIAKLKPFADVLPAYDKEAQKKAYYGETAIPAEAPARKRVDEDDEEEQPKRRARAVEDEEDSLDNEPEVDAEEESLDEEEETPKPKARKPAVVEDDEDGDNLEYGEDEESEPDEVDEEEDVPVAKKKAKKVVEEDDEELEEEPVKPRKKR